MKLYTIAFVAALAPATAAQSSLVYSMDGDEIPLDGAAGLESQRTFLQDELIVFTPGGNPSARTFLSYDAQWAYIGDLDNDGTFVDSSSDGPGGDTNAVFVKRFPAAATSVGPRDIYMSKEANTNLGGLVDDGGVFRYDAQGSIEVFVSEDDLNLATGGSIDLDAICQDDQGNLYISIALDSGGFTDADVILIPAAAITYDANDNVSAIVAGSAISLSGDPELNGWVANSGFATSVGGSAASTLDLSGLEIDPAGGTWVSPITQTAHPNLLFVWSGFSNDGGILSTAGGGSIATINGVPMASATATTGAQIGLLPDSTGLGGIMGLGLIPQAQPMSLENWPRSLITTSTILFTRQEVGGATPGGLVAFFYDNLPNTMGTAAGSVPLPPSFGGQLLGDGSVEVFSIQSAGFDGFASATTQMPTTLWGSDLYILLQAYDVASATFSTPSTIDFL
ncbi:MAG: hypothetical protein WD226_03050 [Planctomycetota bacterium]